MFKPSLCQPNSLKGELILDLKLLSLMKKNQLSWWQQPHPFFFSAQWPYWVYFFRQFTVLHAQTCSLASIWANGELSNFLSTNLCHNDVGPIISLHRRLCLQWGIIMMAGFSFPTLQYSSSCPCLVVQQQALSQQRNVIQGVLGIIAMFPRIIQFSS
jgi:hypothetical protein